MLEVFPPMHTSYQEKAYMLASLVGVLGKIGISLLMSLLTETFLKQALILGLEKLVKLTASDLDDKLLQAAEEAWGTKKHDLSADQKEGDK